MRYSRTGAAAKFSIIIRTRLYPYSEEGVLGMKGRRVYLQMTWARETVKALPMWKFCQVLWDKPGPDRLPTSLKYRGKVSRKSPEGSLHRGRLVHKRKEIYRQTVSIRSSALGLYAMICND
jgi:hypothetical protein